MSDYDYGDSGYGFGDYSWYEPTNIVSDGLESSWTDFVWGDAPGADSSTAVDSSSGNITYQYDDGSTLTVGPNGQIISNTESPDSRGNSAAFNRALAWTTRNLGPTAARVMSNVARSPGASLATALAAAKAFSGSDSSGGYNKPVPKMDVVREQVQYSDPNRRSGESGRQYFTDPRFVAQGNAEALAAARDASAQQAAGIQAAYQARPAPAPNPYAGKMNLAFSRPGGGQTVEQARAAQPAAALPEIPTQLNAEGGIPMAQGGLADAGRYLQGKTDGMADEIPSSIDGEQPAALSHGEFVIPADVVSHLGNGNSDAGAQKLYEMMDRIRMARTGTKEQGKEINPDEFTMGGLASAYAGGGQVQRFQTGGAAVTPNPTGAAAGGVPQDVSRTSTLSPWVGDYVTDALGRGAALANQPYEAYKGPLTAGASDLQQQAFAGASEIAGAGFTPTQFTGGLFDTQAAQTYMNPYLSAALDPQLRELNRQAQIKRLEDSSRLTRAGAYGGSRQAIMESEGNRNLLDMQRRALGEGYATAYDKAMAQFNADQGRSMEAQRASEESRRFGADFGLKSVGQLADLGATQRAIDAEGIAADKAQFEEQRDFAYGMPKYQLGLLSGLPIGANTTSQDLSGIAKIQSDIAGLGSMYQTVNEALKNLGQTQTTTPTTTG